MSQAAAVRSPGRFIPSAGSLETRFWVGPLDLRPISLFRICFGLLLLYDLLDLLPNVGTFFSDTGVMPRTVLLTDLIRPNRFSLSDAFGPPPAMVVYWVLVFAACLCVTIGYRTRLAAPVAYLFIAGFNERLPELFDGADSVIRLTLFWLCFCPAGNRYSIDSLQAQARGRPLAKEGMALPIRIIQGQIAWVYLCSYLHKLGGNTWRNGTALHYVLHLNHVFARPWASVLADAWYPMQIGTWFALGLEISFLFLVFAPVLNRYLKIPALVGGLLMHGGIALTVNVGLFSYLMPITYLAFLEPEWVEWGLDRLRRLCATDPVAVIFDGGCRVCEESRARFAAMDRFQTLTFLDFRKDELPAKAKDAKPAKLERRLHVVTASGELLSGWPALAVLFRHLPATCLVGFLMNLPVVFGVGSAVLDWSLDRRHALLATGAVPPQREAPPLLSSKQRTWLGGVDSAALFTLFFGTAWYAAPKDLSRSLPRQLSATVQWFSLWNIWDMFSPEPLRTDYHLRAIAEYSDGSTDDLFGGPADGPGEIRGFWFHRWFKYLENVTGGGEVIPREWGRWQCREHNWDRKPGQPTLYTFTLKKENQIIPPIGQPWPPVQTADVWIHRCYDKK